MTTLDHFRELDSRLKSARLAYNAAQSDLYDKHNEAQVLLAELQLDPNADEDRVSQALASVRLTKKALADLKAPSLINPLGDIEKFLRGNSNAPAEPVPQVKVPEGITASNVHHNLLEKTDKIAADIQRTLAAPVNDPASIARQIEALATPLRVTHGRVHLPRTSLPIHGAAALIPNAEGLLVWLLKEQLISAAQKLAMADGPAVTPQAREESLASLYDKFAHALRLESHAATLAEQAGQHVVRRRHVHPAILLNRKADPKSVWDWFSNNRGV